MVADGVPFWCELKATKNDRVNISPHQVAWHMAYFANGGASFFLVKHLSSKHIVLFDGKKGPEILEHGVHAEGGLWFKNLDALFEALRPHAAAFFGTRTALRPRAAPFPAKEGAEPLKTLPTKEAQFT